MNSVNTDLVDNKDILIVMTWYGMGKKWKLCDHLLTLLTDFQNAALFHTMNEHCSQSRSSLDTEYARCVEPPKHQGAPLLSKMFEF